MMDKIKLLIAEDSEFNQLLLTQIFENTNFDFEYVENGKQVIEKFEKNEYDAILMDIEMPVMNGIEATMIIRNEFENDKNSIPIIALTSHKDKEKREELFGFGIDDLIEKPFSLESIVSKLNKVLNISETAAISKTHESGELFNLSHIKDISDGDDEFVKEMISIFIENTPSALSRIKEYYLEKKWEDIRREAHKLSPHMSFLGITSVIDEIEDIEKFAENEVHLEEIYGLVEKVEKVCISVISILKEKFI